MKVASRSTSPQKARGKVIRCGYVHLYAQQLFQLKSDRFDVPLRGLCGGFDQQVEVAVWGAVPMQRRVKQTHARSGAVISRICERCGDRASEDHMV